MWSPLGYRYGLDFERTVGQETRGREQTLDGSD